MPPANGLANVLTGNAGNNVLDGLSGADTMIGGLGSDTYVVDNVGDVVVELAGEGVDFVRASVTMTLGANVENLTLIGVNAINGTGNELGNIIVGNGANNTLDGGLGADLLIGGLGNDTYVVDQSGDVVTELAGEGTDLVRSSISYTLGGNVENLTLIGTDAINGTGNDLNNVITGNSVGNTLDGGLGSDTLIGGLGDDTFIVDNVGDVVTESSAAGGTDTILSSVSFTASGNVEILTLTGSGNNNATGNTLANTLTGNAGDNILNGGTGADLLIGGFGNDTYIVDNVRDAVTETGRPGSRCRLGQHQLHSRRQR